MKALARKCRTTLPLLLLPGAAIAATAQVQLEEITVTAGRVAGRLHELPVSATVVDGATLDDTAVTRWEDIPLPGIKVGPAGLTDVLSIRGMASGIDFGFEQSAPVFIDGVWFGSSRASRIGFLDTAQVEILKGPQPTWYGKNATAGAFGIITRKPHARREAWLDAFHEIEHAETALTGVLNLPLNEQLAVRMAGKWRRMDGFMTNSVDGQKSPHYRDYLGRASLRWTPSPGWTVDAKLEYSDNLTTGRETQYVRCAATAFANRRLLNPAFEDCEFDLTRTFRYDPAAYGVAMALFKDPERPGERIRNQMLSGRAAAEGTLASGHVLQAIVAYYDHDFLAWVKQDHSWNQRLLAVFDDSNRLASQELRLASPASGRWSWNLGAYHEDVARSNGPFTQVILPLPQMQARTTNWYEDSSAWRPGGGRWPAARPPAAAATLVERHPVHQQPGAGRSSRDGPARADRRLLACPGRIAGRRRRSCDDPACGSPAGDGGAARRRGHPRRGLRAASARSNAARAACPARHQAAAGRREHGHSRRGPRRGRQPA
ncbi:MAG: TonB-dependent receptor plug domain-containing protein [Pseudomonadota bacterium]|jgi:outer membrane receptor protein involved in Fe transport